jgi:hypothetical protein
LRAGAKRSITAAILWRFASRPQRQLFDDLGGAEQDRWGHGKTERLVSQNHRHVAAELLAALNVYCAFMLSRQMFMAGLSTMPHRTDSSGSAQADRDTERRQSLLH